MAISSIKTDDNDDHCEKHSENEYKFIAQEREKWWTEICLVLKNPHL